MRVAVRLRLKDTAGGSAPILVDACRADVNWFEPED